MTTRRSALQEEIQQSRPFSTTGQEATLGLFRTADMVRQHLQGVLDPFGVTPQQYNVLRILRGAGGDGLPTLAIGERMLERTPGITRLIDRLVKKGWVDRQRSATDRRQVMCRITDDGRQLLADLDEPVERMDGNVLGMLDQAETRQLIGLLDRIRLALRAPS